MGNRLEPEQLSLAGIATGGDNVAQGAAHHALRLFFADDTSEEQPKGVMSAPGRNT
ncbi:MAG: hypothetical protein MUD11_07255 [Rhodobacteraceae bacterium]|jgi:hypothetical protein|nr:hypothetical protein [Paracoccaceae bacterium]